MFRATGLGGMGEELIAAHAIARYRGPDDAGLVYLSLDKAKTVFAHVGERAPEDAILRKSQLALGHRRLSILDLTSAGHQPMGTEDGLLWITYNGEVYNYSELRSELERQGSHFRSQSDTEVILNAYRLWGDRCVERFIGMWAFCIADLARSRLFCSRDRFGIKPFHYCHGAAGFAFASEIKQLLELNLVERRVHDRAVYEYLISGSFDYSAHSFFEGIQRLEPGCNLVVDLAASSVTTHQYYSLRPLLTRNTDVASSAARFHDLLDESVRLQLRSDVEVGSCLSGGLDSSSIVCLAHRQLMLAGRASVQRTFSSHFDDPEANELEYLREVIAQTRVNALIVQPTAHDLLRDLDALIWHQEEPFGSTSIFAQWSVFRLVHECGVKVMLDGQGADELLAGYIGLIPTYLQELRAKHRYFSLLWETLSYRRLHAGSWHFALPAWCRALAHRLSDDVGPPAGWLRPDFARLHVAAAREVGHQRDKEAFSEQEHLSNALFRMTFFGSLSALLRYEDRNSMAFSVEARVPYLDHRFVEFALSLPSDLKIRNGYTKYVMRQAMKGILPEKVRTRVSKLGFATPERRWQLDELRPLIEDSLGSDTLRRFIVPDKARSYLAYVDDAGVKDFLPWRWLNLKLWMERYALA